MDAFDFIAKENKRIERALTKLANTPTENLVVREKIFVSIKGDLEIHMKIEESILYPLLKQQTETRGKTFEGIVEHDAVKNLLSEMASMPTDNEEWTVKLNVIRENMKNHYRKKEEDLFPEARKILSQDEIDDLGRRLLTAREGLNDTIIYS